MEPMENYLGEPYSLEDSDSDSSCYDYTNHTDDVDPDDFLSDESEADYILEFHEYDCRWTGNQQSIFTAIEEGRLKDLKKLIDSSQFSLLMLYECLRHALSSDQLPAAKLILQTTSSSAFLKSRRNRSKFDEEFLAIGVQIGNEKVVKFLLNQGANAHITTKFDYPSIQTAVQKNYTQIVESLLISGADVNSRFVYNNGRQEYALVHHAVSNGNEPIIKLLVQFGADIDSVNSDGLTPLHIAVQKGFLEITEYLILEGANTNPQFPSTDCENDKTTKEGCTPLQAAIQNRHKKIIQLLLESGADVNAQDNHGNTVLKLAVETRCPEIVTYVLNYCPDVNDENNKAALSSAIFSMGTDDDQIILQILLHHGFTLRSEDKNNSDLLFNAVRGNYSDIIRLLLIHGADINKLYDGNDPYFTFCSSLLHVAVIRGDMDVVTLLIEYRAKLDARNTDGKTPLLFATALSESEITTVLLKNGAKVFNSELLVLATKKSSTEVMKIILEKGVNVNEKISFRKELCRTLSHLKMHGQIPSNHTHTLCDEWSETALHVASDLGCYEKVKLLLEHDAEVNSTNHLNMTSLFFSARTGHNKIVKLLLKEGAKITLTDRSGRTALHEAAKAGHCEVVKLLIEFGAIINAEDEEGKTPLFISAEANHWKVAEVLLKFGATVEKSIRAELSALDIAIQNVDDKIVKLLVEYGAKIVECKHFESSLAIFINKQKPEIVEILLKSGADVNSSDWLGRSMLSLATELDAEEMVELLLNYGLETFEVKDYTEPLLISAEKGNLKIVERLLKSNACVINSADKRGHIALFKAAAKGQTKTVEALLKYGAAVNYKTSDGETPLFISASKGHLDTVQVLLNSGAMIDSTDNGGRSPVYVATREGHVEIVKLLLRHRARTDIKTLNGETPLSISAGKGSLDIFEVLIKSSAEINSFDEDGKSPLYNASKEGHAEIVKQLLEYGAVINIQTLNGETPLFISASKGHLDVVETLLNFDSNIAVTTDTVSIYNASEEDHMNTTKRLRLMKHEATTDLKTLDGETPLSVAARNGHLSIVEILLKFGAEINPTNKYNNTPLLNAVTMGHMEIMELLLKHGAATEIKSVDDETPLLYATKRNKVKAVQMLLKYGANANAADNEGTTAIQSAALTFHNSELVKLLMRHGAEIDYKNAAGRTTLSEALKTFFLTNTETLENLLECGANTESTDLDGNRPLHLALKVEFRIPNTVQNSNESVKLLLKYGADVDARGKKGETPLFVSARYGSLKNCKTLLEAGANINAADSSGTTPLFTAATSTDSDEIVQLLLDQGAEIDSKTLNGVESTLLNEDISSDKIKLSSAEIILQHIVKVEAANLYKGTKSLETLSNSTKIKIDEFKNKCEVEITKMMSEYINDSKVTFYEILTKNLEQLNLIAKNDSIVQILKTGDHTMKFPIYANAIEIQIRKGIIRKDLMEQGIKFYDFLINRYGHLPYILMEKVLSYLSNQDLKVFIDTCKSILENLYVDLFDDYALQLYLTEN